MATFKPVKPSKALSRSSVAKANGPKRTIAKTKDPAVFGQTLTASPGWVAKPSTPKTAAQNAAALSHLPGILREPIDMAVHGQVVAVDRTHQTFTLKMRDGAEVEVSPQSTSWYKVMQNMDGVGRDQVPEPAVKDKDGVTYSLDKYVQVGRTLTMDGTYHPEKSLYIPGEITLMHSEPHKFGFEDASWWSTQLSEMSNQWVDVLFKGKTDISAADFGKHYQTYISGEGKKLPDPVQETAQLSRLLYTFTSSYMATGDVRFLKVAKAGVDFQREKLRVLSEDGQSALWYAGRRPENKGAKKPGPFLASENADDWGAVPLYEQIYALTGLTMYYRASHDPAALQDITLTLNAFEKHFYDAKNGGYFSHVDPVHLKPDAESLGDNRSKKNWNSIGDHIPAYLINLMASLGPKTANAKDPLNPLRVTAEKILKETSELIVKKFPDEKSVFVQERFLANWDHDKRWRWQQDRAVVGHNFKISWNLTRVAFHFQTEAKAALERGQPKVAADFTRRADEALALAKDLAIKMSEVGIDKRVGGIYDVVDRTVGVAGPKHNWGTHKDFWQQEQGILALQIQTGANPEYRPFLSDARNTQAFWANFATKEGIGFRTNQGGLPDKRGSFANLGDHATLYHGAENAFLARWYNALYVTKEKIDIHYSLAANRVVAGEKEVISVIPDFVAPGHVAIDSVTLNGVTLKGANPAIDQQKLTVTLKPEFKGKEVQLTVNFKPLGKPLNTAE